MTALPEAFIAYCNENFAYAEELIDSLNQDSPTSIRINTAKSSIPELEKVKWCNTGFYLSKRPTFTEDPLFHAGAYYVQEASSMLISQVSQLIDCDAPIKILDLCAAPGGKTTLLLDLFPNSLVVANEIIPKRAKILAENITKWGTQNCIITNASPEQLAKSKEQFDLILVDAPCSGEGMFRKDLNAREEWSSDNVQLCTTRQQDIIETIHSNLKKDGILIYSTCTFNKFENEKNIDYFINDLNFEELSINVPEGVYTHVNGYGMLPQNIKGEGFYAAFLKKTNDGERVSKKIRPSKNVSKSNSIIKDLENTFTSGNMWSYNEDIYYFQEEFISTLFNLQQHLRIIQFGHKLGKEIKGKFIPSPELHTLPAATDLFPKIEVSHSDAIKFLKKEDISVPAELDDGYYFICFMNTPIGIVKKIGNRINNNYPKEWRIINPQIEAKYTLADF